MVARFRTPKAAKIAMMNAALRHVATETVQVTTCQQEKKYGGGWTARLTVPGTDISLTAYNDTRWRAAYSPLQGGNMHGFEFTGESAEEALRQLVDQMGRCERVYKREASHISL